MEIIATFSVQQITKTWHFDEEDLGVSKEEWDALSENGKNELIQEAIDNMPEQPVWMLEKWTN